MQFAHRLKKSSFSQNLAPVNGQDADVVFKPNFVVRLQHCGQPHFWQASLLYTKKDAKMTKKLTYCNNRLVPADSLLTYVNISYSIHTLLPKTNWRGARVQ
jgi:hypothetical protein